MVVDYKFYYFYTFASILLFSLRPYIHTIHTSKNATCRTCMFTTAESLRKRRHCLPTKVSQIGPPLTPNITTRGFKSRVHCAGPSSVKWLSEISPQPQPRNRKLAANITRLSQFVPMSILLLNPSPAM